MQAKGKLKPLRFILITSLIFTFTFALSHAAMAVTFYVTQKAPILTPRMSAQSGVVNGKIYILGGSNNFNPVPMAGNMSTVEEFDPASLSNGTWQTMTPMIEPRVLGGSITWNNSIYIFGGWNGTDMGSIRNSVLKYDPSANGASSIVGTMQYNRGAAPAVRIGNYAYIIGGAGSAQAPSTMEVYDLNNNTHATPITMPFSIESPNAVVYNNKIYIIGGWDTANNWNPTNACWEYNPTNGPDGTFTPLHNLPIAIASAGPKSAFCDNSNGMIYVVSGATANLQLWPNINPVASILEYSVASDTWNVVGSVPGTRGAAILEGVYNASTGNTDEYMISGCNAQYTPLNTNEILTIQQASNFQATVNGQGAVTCNCNGNVITATMPAGTTPGTLGVALTASGPSSLPPGILPASPYFDISTTSLFSGNIEITLPYDQGQVADPLQLRVYHWNGSSWVDITIPGSLNTTDHTIKGSTTSLSPFVIGEMGGSGSSEVPASSAWSLGLMILGALTILIMRRNAKKA